MQNITVTGCSFAGFQNGLFFQGGWDCSICNNSFLYPMGRDSGSYTNGFPNVGILLQGILWPPPVASYWNQMFYISNNYFNGLLGTNSVNILGDGLVQATVDGLDCYGNTVSNNGAEGIFIGNLSNNLPVYPCSIHNNTIAKQILLGAGTGIRCDLSGSQVYNNT